MSLYNLTGRWGHGRVLGSGTANKPKPTNEPDGRAMGRAFLIRVPYLSLHVSKDLDY